MMAAASSLSSRRTPLNSVHRRHLASRTPSRTPYKRRIGSLGTTCKQPRVVNETETSHLKGLLCGRTWQAYRVTPLYNYKTDEPSLKRYSCSLSACLKAEAQKGVFIDASIPGNATIASIDGFQVGIYDPKAIHIKVKGQAKNRNAEKIVCQAVLFSTDLEATPVKPSQQRELTYLTTMIFQGSDSILQVVQGWFEAQFDCLIKPLQFDSQDLKFMAAIFTSFREEHRALELVYKTPVEIEGLDTITYATDAKDCLTLWNCIQQSQTDVLTWQDARHFISGLEGHFFECFKIKLEALTLSSLDCAVASLDTNGKIRFYTKKAENILKVCRHLTDLSFDQLKGC